MVVWQHPADETTSALIKGCYCLHLPGRLGVLCISCSAADMGTSCRAGIHPQRNSGALGPRCAVRLDPRRYFALTQYLRYVLQCRTNPAKLHTQCIDIRSKAVHHSLNTDAGFMERRGTTTLILFTCKRHRAPRAGAAARPLSTAMGAQSPSMRAARTRHHLRSTFLCTASLGRWIFCRCVMLIVL